MDAPPLDYSLIPTFGHNSRVRIDSGAQLAHQRSTPSATPPSLNPPPCYKPPCIHPLYPPDSNPRDQK